MPWRKNATDILEAICFSMLRDIALFDCDA